MYLLEILKVVFLDLFKNIVDVYIFIHLKSKMKGGDQKFIQSNRISRPQNQKGKKHTHK